MRALGAVNVAAPGAAAAAVPLPPGDESPAAAPARAPSPSCSDQKPSEAGPAGQGCGSEGVAPAEGAGGPAAGVAPTDEEAAQATIGGAAVGWRISLVAENAGSGAPLLQGGCMVFCRKEDKLDEFDSSMMPPLPSVMARSSSHCCDAHQLSCYAGHASTHPAQP